MYPNMCYLCPEPVPSPLSIFISMDTAVPFLLTALMALLAGILLHRTVSGWIRIFILRRRFARGSEGEREAEAFLKKHGYRILENQAPRRMTMLIDGEPRDFEVRADYIAAKKGRTCIVEVKTGDKAVDPAAANTRRQLLEYAVSYRADDLFLFDAESGEMHQIEFPSMRIRRGNSAVPFIAGFFIGLITGAILFITL